MVKLRIVEDYEGELEEKGGDLVKALTEKLAKVSPEAANLLDLIKGKIQKEQQLKYPTLRELQKKTTKIYDEQMKEMLTEIGTVFDRTLKKAAPIDDAAPFHQLILDGKKPKLSQEKATYFYEEGAFYNCGTCTHWVPGGTEGKAGNPALCVLHEENEHIESNGHCKFWKAGEPVPGRQPQGHVTKKMSLYYENDYHTGFRCNRCQYYQKGGACKIVEGKIKPEGTCSAWRVAHNVPIPIETSATVQKAQDENEYEKALQSFIDPTHAIAEKDKAKYLRVRAKLKQKGATDEDFDLPTGKYYGQSVNELLLRLQWLEQHGE